jgi:hypothetical protein
MSDTTDLRAVGDRIEGLLEEVGTIADPRVQAKVEELVRLLLEFYGAGLARILEIVSGDDAAPRLQQQLTQDEVVAALMVLHDLHPEDVETRIRRALDGVQLPPGSPVTGITLLGVDEGVVGVRIEGNLDGRSSAAITLRHHIERAIEAAAPEVTGLEIEGITEPPAPAPHLVQIQPRGTANVSAGAQA